MNERRKRKKANSVSFAATFKLERERMTANSRNKLVNPAAAFKLHSLNPASNQSCFLFNSAN